MHFSFFLRHGSGGSMFARRSDFSSFNVLPRHKINSYHIKVGADLVQFIHVVLFAHSPVCFPGFVHALMVMTLIVMKGSYFFPSDRFLFLNCGSEACACAMLF